jgi:hypothetical protein
MEWAVEEGEEEEEEEEEEEGEEGDDLVPSLSLLRRSVCTYLVPCKYSLDTIHGRHDTERRLAIARLQSTPSPPILS